MISALVALAVVVAIVLAIVGVGSALPREHVATVRARFAASPHATWMVISDPLGASTWRTDVKSIEALPDRDGRRAWREVSGSGTVTFVLAETTPERAMVTRIADDDLPFGGQWEFALHQSGAGSELTITERGFVKPALFRFMARYVFGYTSTMKGYLIALGARLGEQVSPEVMVSGR